MKTYRFGTINLGSEVYVSDPCYSLDVWCMHLIDNVLSGEYKTYTKTKEIAYGEKSVDERASELIVCHKDYKMSPLKVTDEVLCSVGVDSGTCGIYDKEYYEKYHFDGTNDDEWYKKNVCNGFWNRKGEASNLDNKGIISCSGYGDGHYTVYVKRNKEGLIYQITIKYIWQ